MTLGALSLVSGHAEINMKFILYNIEIIRETIIQEPGSSRIIQDVLAG